MLATLFYNVARERILFYLISCFAASNNATAMTINWTHQIHKFTCGFMYSIGILSEMHTKTTQLLYLPINTNTWFFKLLCFTLRWEKKSI